MGKKKTKTGKQRQAKAKSLQSKKLAFHVPVSKAGQLILSSHSSASSRSDHVNSKQSKKHKRNVLHGSNSKSTKTKVSLNQWKSEEDRAYEQEYNSLQERQYHAQMNKTDRKKNKDISLAPATLQLKMDQTPTADELIQDTAQKLDGLMSSSNTTTPITSFSNNPQTYNNQKIYMNPITNKNEENKFWLLNQDDEDSDEETTNTNGKSKTAASVSPFQFAAPSFSLPLSSCPNELDHDPDL